MRAPSRISSFRHFSLTLPNRVNRVYITRSLISSRKARFLGSSLTFIKSKSAEDDVNNYAFSLPPYSSRYRIH